MTLRRIAGQAEEIVAGAAMVIVVLAVCWGVATRCVTAQPAPWAGEVAAFGFAWSVSLAPRLLPNAAAMSRSTCSRRPCRRQCSAC